MKYRRLTEERRIRLISNKLVAVNNCDNAVLLESVCIVIIPISVVSQYFAIIRFKISTERRKPIHSVKTVTLSPITFKCTRVVAYFLKIIKKFFIFLLILIVAHSVEQV